MSAGAVSLETAVQSVQALIARRGGAPSEVGPDTRLDDLGLDSTDIVDLFLDLEQRAGCALDPDSAIDVTTVSDLVTVATA